MLLLPVVEGPWLIYDHYLSIREYSANFCPSEDDTDEIAVWVKIPGLPIEYYSNLVLAFISDRIGKTIKVHKNSLTRERGKYAQLCIQVDLKNLY